MPSSSDPDSGPAPRRLPGTKLVWAVGTFVLFGLLVAGALKLRLDDKFVLGELLFIAAWAVVFAFWWGSRRGWFG